MVPFLTLFYESWSLSEVIATSLAVSFGLTFVHSLLFLLKGSLPLSVWKPLLPLLFSLLLGAWLVSPWSFFYGFFASFIRGYFFYGVLLLLAWHLLFPSFSPLKPMFQSASPPPRRFFFQGEKGEKYLSLLKSIFCGLLAGCFFASTGMGAGLLLSAFLWSLATHPPAQKEKASSVSSLSFLHPLIKPEWVSPLVNILVSLAAFGSCISFMAVGMDIDSHSYSYLGGGGDSKEQGQKSLWQWGWIHGDVALKVLLGSFLSLPLSLRWRGRLSPEACKKGVAFLLLFTLYLIWRGKE